MIPPIKYREFLDMTDQELVDALHRLQSNLRKCEIAIKEKKKLLR